MRSRQRSPFSAVLLFAVSAVLSGGAAACAAEAVGAIGIEARLVAPAGSESELKSALTLPVRALPTAINQPAPKGAVLVEMDVAKLQKELEGLRKDLTRAQNRKREPLATFVEAKKTVVETAVPAAAAAAFAVGASLRIADATDSAVGFRGKVLAATPEGETVALRIQPLELPFLALDSTASARLSLAP